jgi:hypothetical protein
MALTAVDGPVQLRIPDACAFCAAVARLTLQSAITADETVLLHWRCTRCGQSWPVTAHDLTVVERRRGTPNRRVGRRADRRRY